MIDGLPIRGWWADRIGIGCARPARPQCPAPRRPVLQRKRSLVPPCGGASCEIALRVDLRDYIEITSKMLSRLSCGGAVPKPDAVPLCREVGYCVTAAGDRHQACDHRTVRCARMPALRSSLCAVRAAPSVGGAAAFILLRESQSNDEQLASPSAAHSKPHTTAKSAPRISRGVLPVQRLQAWLKELGSSKPKSQAI